MKKKLIIILLLVIIIMTFIILICNDKGNDNQTTITESEAKQKADEWLGIITKTEYNINNATIKKNEQGEWNITNEQYEMEISSNEGKLLSYRDKYNDTKIKATATKEQVETLLNDIIKKYKITSEYNLKSLEKIKIEEESCLWQADLCKMYDGTYNPYQLIRIVIIPEIERVKAIICKDEKFDNNKYKIQKNEAEEIAKKQYSKAVNEIKTNKKIYKKDSINARNVWSIEIIEEDQSSIEYVIDGTSGEILDIINTYTNKKPIKEYDSQFKT